MSHLRKSSYISVESLGDIDEYCLQKVFEYLDIKSLVNVADVCVRFRAIAELVFRDLYSDYVIEDNHIETKTFRQVMSKFGHLVTSIDATDIIDAHAIAYHCDWLDKLTLKNVTINCEAIRPIFARLKYLDFESCTFIGNADEIFKNCFLLEELAFVANGPSKFLVQTFPKLNSLECALISFETLCGLLALNPQLLNLDIVSALDDDHISAICKYTPNLEALTSITPPNTKTLRNKQTTKGFLQLANLKRLKQVMLESEGEKYMELIRPLSEAFFNARIAIEKLLVCSFRIDSITIKSVKNLKTLTTLHLHQIEGVLERDLISLASELPLLTNLQLHFKMPSMISLSNRVIAKLVQNGKRLNFLSLWGPRHLFIDVYGFRELIKAAKNVATEEPLCITIVACSTTSTFNVPAGMQNAYRDTLALEFFSWNCKCETCVYKDNGNRLSTTTLDKLLNHLSDTLKISF